MDTDPKNSHDPKNRLYAALMLGVALAIVLVGYSYTQRIKALEDVPGADTIADVHNAAEELRDLHFMASNTSELETSTQKLNTLMDKTAESIKALEDTLKPKKAKDEPDLTGALTESAPVFTISNDYTIICGPATQYYVTFEIDGGKPMNQTELDIWPRYGEEEKFIASAFRIPVPKDLFDHFRTDGRIVSRSCASGEELCFRVVAKEESYR